MRFLDIMGRKNGMFWVGVCVCGITLEKRQFLKIETEAHLAAF